MNFLRRGLKSIIGNKIKSIILLLLIIILGSVTVSAIIVTNGIHSTTTHLRRSRPAIVMTKPDTQALIEAGYTIEDIAEGRAAMYFQLMTSDLTYEVAALPQVRDFSYHYALEPWLHSFGLRRYIPEGGEGEGMDLVGFRMTALSRPTITQIDEGFWELVAGRLFTEAEMQPDESRAHIPILISQSVANLNELSVSSTFTLYDWVSELKEDAVIPTGLTFDEAQSRRFEYSTSVYRPLSFEVVGIINMPYEPSDRPEDFAFQDFSHNRLTIPHWKAAELADISFQSDVEWLTAFGVTEESEGRAYFDELERFRNLVAPVWVLYDPLYFDAFAQQANELLPEFNIVEDMSFIHQNVLTSMSSVNSLMNQALIVVIGATLIVLTLLILLYLRDRKYEIGIYMALGEKKRRIIFQILFELLSITTVGIVIALFIGNLVSHQVSNFLLREAFLNTEEVCEFPTATFCFEPIRELEMNGFALNNVEMEIDELIEIFDVSLDLRIMLIFFGIGLTTTILSAIVPVLYVLEMKPKEILLRGNIG